jgi:hypothetical protein
MIERDRSDTDMFEGDYLRGSRDLNGSRTRVQHFTGRNQRF